MLINVSDDFRNKVYAAYWNAKQTDAPFGAMLNFGRSGNVAVVNNPNSDRWHISVDEEMVGSITF